MDKPKGTLRPEQTKETFRCCVCEEEPVYLWFSSSDLAQNRYGVCRKCMIKYLDFKDGLTSLKSMLRSADHGAVSWAKEEPKPSESLEDWENDLFD